MTSVSHMQRNPHGHWVGDSFPVRIVSLRMERIERAKADWAAGRFAPSPDDQDEWIPLPR